MHPTGEWSTMRRRKKKLVERDSVLRVVIERGAVA